MEKHKVNNNFYFDPKKDIIEKMYVDQERFRDLLNDHYLNFMGDLGDVVQVADGWVNISNLKKCKFLETDEVQKEIENKKLSFLAIQNIMLQNKSVLVPPSRNEYFAPIEKPTWKKHRDYILNYGEPFRIKTTDLNKDHYESQLRYTENKILNIDNQTKIKNDLLSDDDIENYDETQAIHDRIKKINHEKTKKKQNDNQMDLEFTDELYNELENIDFNNILGDSNSYQAIFTNQSDLDQKDLNASKKQNLYDLNINSIDVEDILRNYELVCNNNQEDNSKSKSQGSQFICQSLSPHDEFILNSDDLASISCYSSGNNTKNFTNISQKSNPENLFVDPNIILTPQELNLIELELSDIVDLSQGSNSNSKKSFEKYESKRNPDKKRLSEIVECQEYEDVGDSNNKKSSKIQPIKVPNSNNFSSGLNNLDDINIEEIEKELDGMDFSF